MWSHPGEEVEAKLKKLYYTMLHRKSLGSRRSLDQLSLALESAAAGAFIHQMAFIDRGGYKAVDDEAELEGDDAVLRQIVIQLNREPRIIQDAEGLAVGEEAVDAEEAAREDQRQWEEEEIRRADADDAMSVAGSWDGFQPW